MKNEKKPNLNYNMNINLDFMLIKIFEQFLIVKDRTYDRLAFYYYFIIIFKFEYRQWPDNNL